MNKEESQIIPTVDVTRRDLISKKEDVQVNALRELYKGYAENTQDKNKKRQTFCKKIAHVYNPAAALTFVFIYWAIGLKNAKFY